MNADMRADPIRASGIISYLRQPGHAQLNNVVVARIFGINEAYVRRAKVVFRWGLTMKIDPRKLRLDGGTQPRAEMDDNLVAEYAEKMAEGVAFPPPEVFYDGVNYWVADGFHRTKAAIRASLKKFEVYVHQGDVRMAVLHSVGVNAIHGLKRSNTDKRRAVMTLLNDEEWHRWSDVQIGKRCGVSHDLVRRIRPESILHSKQDRSPRRATRNGKEYQIDPTNIGTAARAKPDPAPTVPDTNERKDQEAPIETCTEPPAIPVINKENKNEPEPEIEAESGVDPERPEMIREDLPRCQFGVHADTEEGIQPCGEGSVSRRKWFDENGSETGWLYLCEKHDEQLLREEEHQS